MSFPRYSKTWNELASLLLQVSDVLLGVTDRLKIVLFSTVIARFSQSLHLVRSVQSFWWHSGQTPLCLWKLGLSEFFCGWLKFDAFCFDGLTFFARDPFVAVRSIYFICCLLTYLFKRNFSVCNLVSNNQPMRLRKELDVICAAAFLSCSVSEKCTM